MGLFKKDVVVKCYTVEELGKMVNWLRSDSSLSEMHRQRYTVTAVMPRIYWENPDELMYFEVTVPYYMYKKLREKFIADEVFDPVLQQRAFNEIMER